MAHEFSESQAQEIIEQNYAASEEILNDPDKLEKLFQRLEKKLKIVPIVGNALADIPLMASLIRSYVQKEYTDIPIGSILAIVGALIYFVSPIDVIPDFVPGAGYVDDGVVVTVCLKMIDSDLHEYNLWREANGKVFDIPDFDETVTLKKKIKRKGKSVD